MKRDTEILRRELRPDGHPGKAVKMCSYVITLCKKDGADVMAVRAEYFQNKLDAHKWVEEKYPGWNVKTINRLYGEDFN